MIRSYERPYEPKCSDHKLMSLDNLGAEVGQFENNSPEQTYSPQDVSPSQQKKALEMHMAEKLVESTTGNNAFKFDTISPLKHNDNLDIQINASANGESYFFCSFSKYLIFS